ncbi:MAG TPA: hypothetical protein VEP90_01705 [Methylomirabilota bacterium]|nr:hypothetical protein [Methylomirabilota bacterium]
MTHYGGETPTCACLGCRETIDQFLCIDHINGGGNDHRKEIKRNGAAFYQWLRTNSYPEGFQVLCHNCNMAKSLYGKCPHEDLNAT